MSVLHNPAIVAAIALLGVLAAVRGEGAGPSPAAGASPAAAPPSPSPGAVAVDARMPPFPTDREDEYLCTAVELPPGDMKLVSVEPMADMRTVHHMLLFGEYKWQIREYYIFMPMCVVLEPLIIFGFG